jgi:hypothetical protein
MRSFASFVAILLLLVTVSPALACVTDRAMSHEESACCTMHNNCGQMAKQGCCRMELNSDDRPQLEATAPHTDVHCAVVARLGSIAVPDRMIAVSRPPAEHAPPGLVTAKAAVLRI